VRPPQTREPRPLVTSRPAPSALLCPCKQASPPQMRGRNPGTVRAVHGLPPQAEGDRSTNLPTYLPAVACQTDNCHARHLARHPRLLYNVTRIRYCARGSPLVSVRYTPSIAFYLYEVYLSSALSIVVPSQRDPNPCRDTCNSRAWRLQWNRLSGWWRAEQQTIDSGCAGAPAFNGTYPISPQCLVSGGGPAERVAAQGSPVLPEVAPGT